MKFSGSVPKKFTNVVHDPPFCDGCQETHGNNPRWTAQMDKFDLLKHETKASTPQVEEVDFVDPEHTELVPERFVFE